MKAKKALIAIFSVFLSASLAAAVKINKAEALEAYTFTDSNWMDVAPETDPVADGEFTLAVFGDTQKTIEKYPQMVKNSMNWLVAEKDRLNLKYVISVGDIMDDVNEDFVAGSNYIEQLTSARDSYDILKKAGVPFALAPGNHDYGEMAFNDRDTSAFDEYFPLSTFTDMPGFGGSMTDSAESSYHYFSQDGEDYMIVTLGHHPTEEILDWANGVIESNPDKKVIVVEHGYLDGGPFNYSSYPYYDMYSGGYGGRTPMGDNVWNKLVSRHENIFMMLCGHELGLDNKRVVRSVAYGEHGNAVHQIMTNPADIEYGGTGMLLLLTFRADGTVDARHYSPTVGKYYGEDSQFSFDIAEQIPDTLLSLTETGASIGTGLEEDFTDYSLGDTSFVSSAYAHGGVILGASGLIPEADGAGIVYKVQADEGSLIKAMRVSFNYSSLSADGGIALATSTDGINYKLFRSEGGVSQSSRLSSGIRQARMCPTEYIYGNKEVFVKLIFMEGSKDNISLAGLKIETTQSTVAQQYGRFSVSLNFADYQRYEVEEWATSMIYNHDLLVFDGLLGTGRADDYAGAKGWAEWDFTAPEGATVETLSFTAKGRLSKKDNTKPLPYALRLEYSLDGGKTYEIFAQEREYKTSFNYNLSSVICGSESVRLRLTLWGDYWTTVGLNNLNISGAYRYGVTYHAGEGQLQDNPSSYVTGEEVNLAPAIAPEYFSFDGWYASADLSTERLDKIPASMSGTLELYAKYKPISYNVIYDLGGGKNSLDNPSTYESYKGAELAPATRSGYTFAGWHLDEQLTVPVSAIEAGTVGDVTLYAKFLKNYRITYVLGGGTLENKVDSFTAEDEIILSAPTMEGYDFAGWFTDTALENEITKIEKGTEAPVVVYAKWIRGSSGDGTDKPVAPSDSGGKKGCGGSMGAPALGIAALAIAAALKKKKSL